MTNKTIAKALVLTLTASAVAIGCAKPRYNETAIAFNGWCSDSTPSIETKKTVNALMELSGQKDCLEAGQALSSAKAMNLSGKEISDVQPIAVFTQVEKLDLSNNNISNIEPLADLESLKEINVAGNSALNASHIEKGLKGLKSLKVVVANSMSGAERAQIERSIGARGLQIREATPAAEATVTEETVSEETTTSEETSSEETSEEVSTEESTVSETTENTESTEEAAPAEGSEQVESTEETTESAE